MENYKEIKYTFYGGNKVKIGYESQQKVYLVKVEYPECETWINADSIEEVKKEFIRSMESLFEATIRAQLNIERGCDKAE